MPAPRVSGDGGRHDSGYFQNFYDEPGSKDTTQESDIAKVVHPLAKGGVFPMKKFNCMQKAITYCILQNGGSVDERYIIRFLHDHWSFVNSDRAHPFKIAANLRLLHINTQARKKDVLLFLRDTQNSKSFICNTPDDMRNSGFDLPPVPESDQDSESEDTVASEEGSFDLGVRAPLGFDDRVLQAVQEAGEATIDDLARTLADRIDADGSFQELGGARRIRAVLIVLKSQKKVICVDGKWRPVNSVTDVKSGGSHSPVPRAGLSVPIKDMTLADFYLFVKERAGL
jgi:hypothetical protein